MPSKANFMQNSYFEILNFRLIHQALIGVYVEYIGIRIAEWRIFTKFELKILWRLFEYANTTTSFLHYDHCVQLKTLFSYAYIWSRNPFLPDDHVLGGVECSLLEYWQLHFRYYARLNLKDISNGKSSIWNNVFVERSLQRYEAIFIVTFKCQVHFVFTLVVRTIVRVLSAWTAQGVEFSCPLH